MQRQFASGSRQAPDPHDQFLEQKGYYRKHTARDSSSLFRVISEQLYDTQMHHLSIRETCVNFMRTHKKIFQNSIKKDIDDYLDELSKPKTSGTLTELHAVAYLYRRNVILFEGFNTGNWFINEPDFDEVFRVFYARDNHFDTIYTNDFIEAAAFCQSITYEILYKHVFKLPDITYAVERMLHANSFECVSSTKTEYDGPYMKRMILDDGRTFNLDRPENTNCILDNHLLCHFHNPDFIGFTQNLQNDDSTTMTTAVAVIKNKSTDLSQQQQQQYGEEYRATKNSLLCEKYVSCVRQLLNEGITPFPYKVAKALDPDIYRNIEFDSWSELKRDKRHRTWYKGDSVFQVGVKCLVKLEDSQSDLFTCHIQEMSSEKGPCLVYIEDLGEKHVVPYDFLKPLPMMNESSVKPSITYSCRLQKIWGSDKKFIKLHGFRKMRRYGNIKTTNGGGTMRNNWISHYHHHHHYDYISHFKNEILITNHDHDACDDNDDDIKNNMTYKLKQFTSLADYTPIPCELTAMPFTVNHNNSENNGNEKNFDKNKNNDDVQNSKAPMPLDETKDAKNPDENNEFEFSTPMIAGGESYYYGHGYPGETYYTPYPCDNSIIQMSNSHSYLASGTPYYCMYNSAPSPYHSSNGGIYMQSPLHCFQQAAPPTANYYPTPTNPYYPPTPSSGSSVGASTPNNTIFSTSSYHNQNSPFIPGARTKNNSNRINFAAKKSICRFGTDLPNDISTLRHFYNLGIEYYKQTYTQNSDLSRENVDSKEINKISSDLQANFKFEDNAVNQTPQNKSDSNNNLTPSNFNGMRRDLNATTTRPFYSRNFNYKKDNNKTYKTSISSQKPSSFEFNKNSNIVNKNHFKTTKIATSNSFTTVTEQQPAIQTNPITTSTSDVECGQAASQYSATPHQIPLQGSYSPYMSPYAPDITDQQHCGNNGGTVLMPPPPPPLYSSGLTPYGVYSPTSHPGQSTTPLHNGLHQHYTGHPMPMTQPPPPSQQSSISTTMQPPQQPSQQPSNQSSISAPSASYLPTPYFSQGIEPQSTNAQAPTGGSSIGPDGMMEANYTFMSFPPTVFYPSAVNGNNATAPPHGFWYPSHQSAAVPYPMPNQGNGTTGNNNSSSLNPNNTTSY